MRPVNRSGRETSGSAADDEQVAAARPNDAPRVSGTVGGWLLLLCLLFIVWQPMTVGLLAARMLGSLSIRPPSVAVILALRVLAAAFGVAAGVALLGRQPGAVKMARLALLASAVLDAVVFFAPSFPSGRAPGEAPWWIAAGVVYYGGWLVFLGRSRRVRALFGPPAS